MQLLLRDRGHGEGHSGQVEAMQTELQELKAKAEKYKSLESKVAARVYETDCFGEPFAEYI